MNALLQESEHDYCPNCTKAGLPLLPLRYSIACNDAEVKIRAPELAEPFGEGVTEIPLPEELARYTLRMLRAGFLYVFNEKRGSWSAYEVEEDGRLLEFPFLDRSPPPVVEDVPKMVCSRHGDPAISKCVIVKDAHKAGSIWLAFTATAWTPAVKRLHERQDVREKHMRRIDVGQWVKDQGGQNQPHLDSLSQIQARVAEFNVPLDSPDEILPGLIAGAVGETVSAMTVTSYRAYASSLVDFFSCANDIGAFLSEVASVGERGRAVSGSSGHFPPCMVALDDPSGIAMDIASLMNERLAEFMVRPDIKRPLVISTAIGSLERAVRNNGELERVAQVQEDAVNDLHVWNRPGWDPRIRTESLKSSHERRLKADAVYRADWEARASRAREDATAQLTEDDVNQAGESAWAKYQRKLQDGQPNKWQQEVYTPAVKAFDKTVIMPLAHSHVGWLTSEKMSSYMDSNHDPDDPDSGVAYCDTVLLCIQDTQAISINSAQYAKWLSEETVGKDNLLLRAISLNQKKVIDSLSSSSGIDAEDWAKMSWSQFSDGYGQVLEQLPASQQSVPARLLVALAGPVMTALDVAVHRGGRPLVIALGLVGRTPVIHTQLRGSLDQAVDDLVARMVRANPGLGRLDRNRLRTRLRNQSAGRRSTTRARGPGARGMNDFQIVVSQLAVNDINGSMSEREQMRRAGQSVLSFEEWQRSPYSRWRTMTQGVNGSIVGVLLNLWSMKALAKAMDESTRHNRKENRWRYSAGILGVVGALSDGLHRALEGAREAGSRLATRINRLYLRVLEVMGRALGFAAALIFSIWDGINAWDEIGVGNYGMAILYGVSAVGSVVAFAALAGWFGPLIFGLSATGVGLVIAAIVVVVAVIIALCKDDKLEAWMRRCWFGTAAAGRYGTQVEEIAELNALLEAS